MYKVMVLFRERFSWECVRILDTEREALNYSKKYMDLSFKRIDDIKVVKIRIEE